jgi:hypothetical protein
MTAEASGRRHQPAGVALEHLPIDPGLVVVALEERDARQLDEVPVPLVALGQQRKVVVELLAALGVAPESSMRLRRAGRS